MSGTLNRYYVTCLTEGIIVATDFRDTIPTFCPNSNLHTIVPVTSADIFDTNTANVVSIFQGCTNTKFYKLKCFTFSIPGTLKNEFTYTTYTPTTPKALFVTPTASNIGDEVSFYFYPDTSIGTTTAIVTIGDTVINTTDLTSLLQVGLSVTIFDGVNKSIITNCIAITASSITVADPIDFGFASGSQVLMYTPRIENLKICNTESVNVGLENFYNNEYPTGLTCKVIYINNNITPKTFSFNSSFRFGH